MVEKKYEWVSIIHFVYWDKDSGKVCDKRADLRWPSDIEDWLLKKKNEIKEGYITLGVNNSELKMEISDMTKDYYLLLIYIGLPLHFTNRINNIRGRRVIFKQENLNLSHLQEMYGIEREYDRSMQRLSEMRKPIVFLKAKKCDRKEFKYLFKK